MGLPPLSVPWSSRSARTMAAPMATAVVLVQPLVGTGWVAGGTSGWRDGWPVGQHARLPTPGLTAVLCHMP